MRVALETASLWTRRQMELETSDPPLLPKDEVVMQWRMCKGVVTEACFDVAIMALKCGGTSATMNESPIARAVRDIVMGLVQAFPAERGRLEVAKMLVLGAGQPQFGVK
jgi:alkylation response protein AidB-like acyl-CoA dehydrogenase